RGGGRAAPPAPGAEPDPAGGGEGAIPRARGAEHRRRLPGRDREVDRVGEQAGGDGGEPQDVGADAVNLKHPRAERSPGPVGARSVEGEDEKRDDEQHAPPSRRGGEPRDN